ncbi:hypothetical protein QF035_010758 [Streptomyces umbrinus]|uniref:Secreted protein n=1 Tax=Streptomyces umbrinus TaxID=67370 RepID=A0ABU0TDY5_9ACTN|nr:hypothetical protein [Streptomyces umbrinus]MDQ1033176.1 hypothetical protein [Streptomyces umbrinus]
MSNPWKVTIIIVAAVAILSTPAVWLLSSPDAGQLAGATIQAAVGIVALIWALFQRPDNHADNVVVGTGQAEASGGGTAVTGIRHRRESSGSAKAEQTGNATASGDGSSAVSGIDYS